MPDAVDIDVRGVSKVYGKVPVLKDVSFHVPAGSTLSLLGPSGCGKSTTLSILAGITEAQTGQVFFGGKPMNDVAMHRRRVGVVFQSYALFPHMTVQRNVEFGPRVQGKGKQEAAGAAASALKLTHLTDFAHRKPKELSGGQRQRVAIARAIASNPQVLLMDEPLSSLDANLREEMQFEIRDLQRQTGISMVFVTHDQQEAMAVGDQLGVLFDGRMRQVGAATDLYDRPVDVDVAKFLGKANLFPVTIGSVRDGKAELAGPSGERWGAVVPAGVQLSAGGDAQLMVRPEALTLYTDGVPEGRNLVRGTVTRATFLGREANVVVRAAPIDLELRCGTDEGGSLRPGDEVYVGWTTDRSTVFPVTAPASRGQDQD